MLMEENEWELGMAESKRTTYALNEWGLIGQDISEIAINLIREGSEIPYISEITGIPMDKIEELRENLK